jgi:hypothetical protein
VKDLGALAHGLLVTAKLEPAPWLGDKSAGRAVPLKKHDIVAARELVDYMKRAEATRFRKEVGAILQRRGSFYWGIKPVRLATSLFGRTASEVVAFLMGAVVLATDPDSGAYLVATWGNARSRSIVASFLFDDVAPSDDEPGDFVVESLSIRGALESYGGGRRPRETLARCKELARLYRRGIWLARLVAQRDPDPDDIERTKRDASPDALYMKERAHLGTHPHFAAYWLLSHAANRRGELADALLRTRTVKNPAIVDLRKKVVRWRVK